MFYDPERKHRHHVSLIMWEALGDRPTVELWCHPVVTRWNNRHQHTHPFPFLQALTPPRHSALLSGGLRALACSPYRIDITAITHQTSVKQSYRDQYK